MKILATEIGVECINPEQFHPPLKAEAQRVWELYQSGTTGTGIPAFGKSRPDRL